MLLAILTLLSGLLISGVAIYYSVVGLTSIFAAAPIPIMVMGASLEMAKLVATVWLKQNWSIAPRLLKAYLIVAITFLMLITSMGIFGFLSKAHSDQSLVSGDVQSKIAIYDDQIKTARDNILADRQALEQMDAQVNQLLNRTTDDRGVNRAVQVRRQQRAERARLQRDIAEEQATIERLSKESAPIRAERRKVEAEVGPIKYIAQLVYGDNPDQNILERAVSWIIVVIVLVFDPLAITLLLASQYSFSQLQEQRRNPSEEETTLEPKETVVPELDFPKLDFSKLEEEPVPDEEPITVKSGIDREEPQVDDTQTVESKGSESRVEIEHTDSSIIIKDDAGVHEIMLNDNVDTYVQNAEQAESDIWTRLSGKTISENEYLLEAERKRNKGDE